jgi:N-carbamoylputrescine amidase
MLVALVSDVFADGDARLRLMRRLEEAKAGGAGLAVLPEIPLNPWSPATRTPDPDDAEIEGGARQEMLGACAREAGIGVVGGAIVIDPATGKRHNTALVFDTNGTLVSTYRKVHLPDEDGFHEPCHYEPGNAPPEVVWGFALPLGIQICSDMNRPQGCHLLAAMGAAAILNPRATQASTYERWKLVFRANALTSTAYVLSVARPAPEHGVPLGGPSIAVDPNGEVIAESTDAVVLVQLDERVVADARRRYPGYLSLYPELYARGWQHVARKHVST